MHSEWFRAGGSASILLPGKRSARGAGFYAVYLHFGFYPVQAPIQLTIVWRGKLSPSEWPEVSMKHKIESLRQLARKYEISHEAVMRALKVAGS